MRLFAGTSGFAYPAWKGSFYPEGLQNGEMLAYYAVRLDAVEINNTFYRMPKSAMFVDWVSKVPDEFSFAIKAPQKITHGARLLDTKPATDRLFEVCAALDRHLGPVLFQLPPQQRTDPERLQHFLQELPPQARVAFEFRHPSWADDAIYTLLGARGAALCVGDSETGSPVPLVPTASFGYLRLRRDEYSELELQQWIARIRDTDWQDVFVFFKHEDEGMAARLALRFRELFRDMHG